MVLYSLLYLLIFLCNGPFFASGPDTNFPTVICYMKLCPSLHLSSVYQKYSSVNDKNCCWQLARTWACAQFQLFRPVSFGIASVPTIIHAMRNKALDCIPNLERRIDGAIITDTTTGEFQNCHTNVATSGWTPCNKLHQLQWKSKRMKNREPSPTRNPKPEPKPGAPAGVGPRPARVSPSPEGSGGDCVPWKQGTLLCDCKQRRHAFL